MMPAVTLAGALALAGCGGGGTTTTTDLDPNPPAKTAAEILAEQRAACVAQDGKAWRNNACVDLSDAEEAAKETGANEADAAEYAESIYHDLGSVGDWAPDGDSSGNTVSDLSDISGSKPPALKTKGKKIMAAAVDGYEYSGRDLENGNRVQGTVFSTKGADTKVEPNDPGNKAAMAIETVVSGLVGTSGVNQNTGQVTFEDGTTPLTRTAQIKGPSSGFPARLEANGGTVQGTFFGAPGEYVCPGSSPCTASVTSAGVSLTSEGWRFNPTAEEDAEFTIPDNEYQEFGWWITENEDRDPRNVDLFAATKGYTVRDVPATVIGSATYTGGAAGIYANHSEIGANTEADYDPFTAEAKLTAAFGANTDTAEVSGEIGKFMVGGESRPWKVYLLSQGFGIHAANDATGRGLDKDSNRAGTADPDVHSRIRWDSGGTDGRTLGNFGGYYVNAYGGTPDATAHPAELGGAFKVSGNNQRLVGSMAATKDK